MKTDKEHKEPAPNFGQRICVVGIPIPHRDDILRVANGDNGSTNFVSYIKLLTHNGKQLDDARQPEVSHVVERQTNANAGPPTRVRPTHQFLPQM